MADNNVSKLSPSNINKKTNSQDLIYKALTDPVFRKQLKDEPTIALGIQKITPTITAEITKILDQVVAIERTVGAVADQLLCACSVTCSVVATPVTIATDIKTDKKTQQ
jgi:uncharacterized protein with von Willebrand factor type A (vWA) domain